MHFKQIIIPLLLVFIINSCKNENRCGYDVVFDVPSEFQEGEDLLIEIKNLPEKPNNTNYELKPVDKEGLSLYGGMVYYSQSGGDESFTYLIEDFSINDVGNYVLNVSTGYDHCKSHRIFKHCDLIPAEAPCGEYYTKNILYIADSPGGIKEAVPSIVTQYEEDDYFSIKLSDSWEYTQYDLLFEFNRSIPNYSSSYKGLNGNTESVMNDRVDRNLYCDIKLDEQWYPTNNFKLFGSNQRIYMERSPGVLKITFCDLFFVGTYGGQRYLSGVIEYLF